MRYRLRRCSCRACAEESTYLKCPWRAKTLHCENADLVDILETGTHVTEMRSVPKPRLTSEIKVFAQEMTAQGLKPVREDTCSATSARQKRGAGGVGRCARARHLHYILQVAVAHRALH
ncbi:hypothetical protein PI125_g25342 [Phytophthora idaei]|nr:hypothetical protein PI125_g25342 [Phytophthora idaei]